MRTKHQDTRHLKRANMQGYHWTEEAEACKGCPEPSDARMPEANSHYVYRCWVHWLCCTA
eukprot:3108058-Pyramimonas_sp.AAC.1